MTRLPLSLLVALALLATSGCFARARFRPDVAPTSLVTVSPGVWVVYDYPEAVFYSDGAYWWWSGGSWYRSPYADSGWSEVEVTVVPVTVRQIDRPQTYVRYRSGGVRRAMPAEHVGGHYDGPGRGRGPSDEPGDRGRGHRAGEERGRGRGHEDRVEVRRPAPAPSVVVTPPRPVIVTPPAVIVTPPAVIVTPPPAREGRGRRERGHGGSEREDHGDEGGRSHGRGRRGPDRSR